MSVISKMSIHEVQEIGGNHVATFHCVYDNTLSESENEDVRFTKASPYGSGSMTIEAGPVFPDAWLTPYSGNQVYFLFNDRGDVPSFDGCLFAAEVTCQEIIDQGYTKQVEIKGYWKIDEDCPIPAEKRLGQKNFTFSLKMGIDNDAASVQFKPTRRYWLTIYDASQYTLSEVLHIARSQ
jgi:hypothetical protein